VLDLSGCHRVLTDDVLAPLLRQLGPALHTLSLSRGYQRLDSRDPRTVSITGFSKLHNATLDRLAGTGLGPTAGCKGLTDLNLSFCDELTMAGLLRLLAGLPQLRSLNLHKCTGLKGTAVATALVEHLPGLEVLVLSDWQKKVCDWRIYLWMPYASLKALSGTRLNRSIVIRAHVSRQVGKATLATLCGGLPKLRRLDVHGCSGFECGSSPLSYSISALIPPYNPP
jgi:hypothetical protein